VNPAHPLLAASAVVSGARKDGSRAWSGGHTHEHRCAHALLFLPCSCLFLPLSLLALSNKHILSLTRAHSAPLPEQHTSQEHRLLHRTHRTSKHNTEHPSTEHRTSIHRTQNIKHRTRNIQTQNAEHPNIEHETSKHRIRNRKGSKHRKTQLHCSASLASRQASLRLFFDLFDFSRLSRKVEKVEEKSKIDRTKR
jgi:hypothetical protein